MDSPFTLPILYPSPSILLSILLLITYSDLYSVTTECTQSSLGFFCKPQQSPEPTRGNAILMPFWLREARCSPLNLDEKEWLSEISHKGYLLCWTCKAFPTCSEKCHWIGFRGSKSGLHWSNVIAPLTPEENANSTKLELLWLQGPVWGAEQYFPPIFNKGTTYGGGWVMI